METTISDIRARINFGNSRCLIFFRYCEFLTGFSAYKVFFFIRAAKLS